MTYSLLEKLSLRASVLRKAPARARKHYNAFHKTLKRLVLLKPDLVESRSRILDLGCGYYSPHTLLFQHMLQPVVGLDITPIFWQDGIVAHYSELRKKGKTSLKASLLTLDKWVEGKLYNAQLARLLGGPIQQRNLDLCTYYGKHFPFEDEVFDWA